MNSSCGCGLKPIQSVVGYASIHPTMAPVGASFLEGQYCNIKATTDNFPALEVATALCALIKAS